MLLIRQIRALLYNEGYTIAGARQRLTSPETRVDLGQYQQLLRQTIDELEAMRSLLRD